jgi:hypothetical protein
MSTYSSLKFELILTGDQSGQWGNTTNTNIGTAINEAIAGSVDITFASADLTLTLTDTNAAQSARNLRLNLTGTAGGAARTLTLGSGCQISKPYVVNNTLANAVTVKNTGGVDSGVVVPAGKSMWLFNTYTSGTGVWNVVDAVSYLSSLTLGTALVATSGGTGQSSYAVGDLLYANTTTTLAKLADVATGNALISGGVTTAPSWGKIGLTTHVSGTLAATNGGTGANTTTTGDLLYGSASDTWTKLAGNTTTTRKYLVSVGDGTNATAPAWDQIDISTSDITGTLAATNGGTAQSTYTTGDTLYSSAANTLTKLAGNTTTTRKYLVSVGDGTNATAPAWDQIDISTGDITGTLAATNGGTGTATTTAGDILYGAASNTWAKLAAGTAGQLLQTNGAAAPSWVNAPTFTGVSSFSAGTTGFTPSSATTGAVTLAGTLAVANGGTGTATPSLVAGTNVTITGTWPNQTINSSGGGGGGTPGGSNTQVQFNSSGSFGGSSAFTWDGASITVNSVKVGRGNGNLANNIAIGNALLALTGGSAYNVAVGYLAMQYATTAAYNVALGSGAIFNARDSTNSFNVAIGQDAGGSLDSRKGVGYGNNFIGYQSGGLYTGSYNVTLGHLAGTNMSTFAQTTANDYNIVIGGYAAIAQNYDSNNCTFVGGGAQQGWNASITNATTLGYQATVTGNNQVQLGNSSTTTYVYGTVQNRSDARDKTDIRDTQLGLDFITALRPVDFKWDYREDYVEQVVSANGTEKPTVTSVQHEKDGSRKRNRYHHGLIAQEVKAILDARGIDFGGYQDHSVAGGKDVLSIGYDELVGPLVKAIQELTARLEALEARN